MFCSNFLDDLRQDFQVWYWSKVRKGFKVQILFLQEWRYCSTAFFVDVGTTADSNELFMTVWMVGSRSLMQYDSRVADTGSKEHDFVEIFFTSLDSSSIEVGGNSVSSQSMLTLSKCWKLEEASVYKASNWCRTFKIFSEKKSANLSHSSLVEPQIGQCFSGMRWSKQFMEWNKTLWSDLFSIIRDE